MPNLLAEVRHCFVLCSVGFSNHSLGFPSVRLALFLFEAEDDAGCAYGEECAVGDDAALAVAQYLVVNKGAGVAGAVAQDMAQASFLVA